MLKTGRGMGLRFNRFRKDGKFKNSFFIVKDVIGGNIPGNRGYILQENGFIVLAENTAKLIIE